LVGKGSKANDKLTFSIARGRDMWLHIRDYSGSHVVVPLGKNEDIDQQTLIDAATLALNYSKAKSGQKGEVIYTRRKNISKRRGSPPGEVQVSVIKTVYIELDKKRITELKDRSKVIG
jgi:predicted ribosome quality control (RQC) complex YloA/Tae2 family protein